MAVAGSVQAVYHDLDRIGYYHSEVGVYVCVYVSPTVRPNSGQFFIG